MPKTVASLCSTKLYNCFLRVKLDTRHNDDDGKFPVCLTAYEKGSSTLYFPMGYRFSTSDFEKICHATGAGRNTKVDSFRPYDVQQEIKGEFDKIVANLRRINPLTLERVKIAVSGQSDEHDSFFEFWKRYSEQKSTNTAESYKTALNSFKKYVPNVSGFNVSLDHVKRWDSGMRRDGKAEATIGMYERACKSVWNKAIAEQLLPPEGMPFGRREQGLVVIPKGQPRKKNYLPVEKMTTLYSVFVNREYPSSWTSISRESRHRYLGLFLASYLCNGFNLADAAHITYDELYFAQNGRALRFIRQKTADRHAQEVIIPIIEPLKLILDQIASTPTLGNRVFPQILDGADDPIKCASRVKLYNGYIKEAVRAIGKEQGLPKSVSCSWCRHSFASNLANEGGVPREYISEAMGHANSSSGPVTALYIDNFPLEKQFEYNNKLLNLTEGEAIASSPAKKMVSLSDEEYAAFLEFQRTRK